MENSNQSKKLDSKTPSGKLDEKWTSHKNNIKIVNPNNKRKHTVLVVGSGLAGASAAADRKSVV